VINESSILDITRNKDTSLFVAPFLKFPLNPNRKQDYRKLAVAELYKQSAQDLDWIKLRMQEIALKIDEEQLNLYITMDFEPQLEDDSSVSSEEADTGFADFSKVDKGEVNWEDFTGWAFQDDAPSTSATDTNWSCSSSKSQDANTSADESESKTDVSEKAEYEVDEGFSAVVDIKAKMKKSFEEEADEPHAYVKFHDDDDESVEGEGDEDGDDDADDDDHYRFVLSEEEGLAASILQTIAGEEVHFETDSEAVDSWAQDGESGTLSGASSGTTLTYDPARIAFREIMNRLPQDKETSSSNSPPSQPPPPPVPNNTPSSTSEEEHMTADDEASNRDHWASFDFASARRQARLARLRDRTKDIARS
jgi:hypothetical protein